MGYQKITYKYLENQSCTRIFIIKEITQECLINISNTYQYR